MSILRPVWLMLLIPVAVVAALALLRPARRVVRVGSLALWTEALERVSAQPTRTRRRIGPSWLLLLTGAILAVLAVSQVQLGRGRTGRRIDLQLWPASELGRDDDSLARAVGLLVERLEPGDRVRLLLPLQAGTETGGQWLSPRAAAEALERIRSLPIPAERLRFAPPLETAAAEIKFLPAGKADPSPGRQIRLPSRVGPVRIDAFSVEVDPDGLAEGFLAVVNESDQPVRQTFRIRGAGSGTREVRGTVSIQPGARAEWLGPVPAAEWLIAELADVEGPGTRHYLARRRVEPRRVAMVGRFDANLQRLIEVHPGLEATAETSDADVVVAIGKAVGPDTPALILDPPEQANPPGWRRLDPAGPLSLRDASPSADHPLLAGVDLSPGAIRRYHGWRPLAGAGGQTLLAAEGRTLIWTDPQAPTRQVWVGFDPAQTNTNLPALPGWVSFLSAAIESIGQARPVQIRYVAERPWTADPAAWQVVAGGAIEPPGWPWPGLYRGSAGQIHAVNPGPMDWALPPEPLEVQVADLALPEARFSVRPIELWPWLLVGAAACWLAGWTLRSP